MDISRFFNFALILTMVTIFTGVVTLVDYIYSRLTKDPGYVKQEGKKKHKPLLIDYCRAFFPVLLIVLIIRSFIAQPYRVPSGSLEPTVKPGDLILVAQYSYGVHLPVWDKTIIPVGKPKAGQVALFYYPVNHNLTFVKRVIGVPGDRISYIDKVLYINGKEQPQKFSRDVTQLNDAGQLITYKVYQETINGVTHQILRRPDMKAINFYDLKVPKGEYFMMGDNRGESDDSRFWGFVDFKNFIGRALLIWMSWDSNATSFSDKIRWHRIGTLLTK